MDMAENFKMYFEEILAVTDETEQEAYRLRFQIYCVERGFEDPETFPDQMEKDEFDERSVHALVRHRKTSLLAGLVRLILPDPNNSNAPFPIELHCGEDFDPDVMSHFNVPRNKLAEVSRFAISKNFKKRAGEPETTSGVSSIFNYSNDELSKHRRIFPHISLGLIAMLFYISQQHKITHWYAVMEPSLSRLLSRFGIHFTKIGPIVDYHGRRQPMIACVNDLLQGVHDTNEEFWELIVNLGGVPSDFKTDKSHKSLAG